MKNLRQTYHIKASVTVVWAALTEPQQIKKWGAGPAKMQTKADTTFTLWGGDIYGTNTKVKINTLLEQDWFAGQWAKPSLVKIELVKERSGTKVSLTHRNIPDKAAAGIKEGWKEYYFEPLKEYVEQLTSA